jgi:hypothetical protein
MPLLFSPGTLLSPPSSRSSAKSRIATASALVQISTTKTVHLHRLARATALGRLPAISSSTAPLLLPLGPACSAIPRFLRSGILPPRSSPTSRPGASVLPPSSGNYGRRVTTSSSTPARVHLVMFSAALLTILPSGPIGYTQICGMMLVPSVACFFLALCNFLSCSMYFSSFSPLFLSSPM